MVSRENLNGVIFAPATDWLDQGFHGEPLEAHRLGPGQVQRSRVAPAALLAGIGLSRVSLGLSAGGWLAAPAVV
jgi:hypothetical protein